MHINRPPDVSLLTSDAEEEIAIEQDPLMHSRISLYLGTQLLSQGRWALDHSRDIDLPTLIMYGEEDTLIDTSSCEHLSIRIGPQATLARWSQRRHDLLHDQGKDEVFAAIARWLRQFTH